MSITIDELLHFYKSPLGLVSQRIIADVIYVLGRDSARGQRVLGLGYATPYLSHFSCVAERTFAFMPSRQGAQIWPKQGMTATALVDPLELPLTDSSIDLVVATHLFEHSEDREELMQELWRIAAPGAQLILVVPRRRGLWAQRDTTPFGHGHPFSRNQMATLLQNHSFVPAVWRDILYLPPSNLAPFLKSAGVFEGVGRFLGLPFAGVSVVKAQKQMYPAVPRKRRVDQFVRLPSFDPVPAFGTKPAYTSYDKSDAGIDANDAHAFTR